MKKKLICLLIVLVTLFGVKNGFKDVSNDYLAYNSNNKIMLINDEEPDDEEPDDEEPDDGETGDEETGDEETGDEETDDGETGDEGDDVQNPKTGSLGLYIIMFIMGASIVSIVVLNQRKNNIQIED